MNLEEAEETITNFDENDTLEKPKRKEIPQQLKIAHFACLALLLLSMFLLAIPFPLIFKFMILPEIALWSAKLPQYPNAYVISTDNGSQGSANSTHQWVYCTDTDIETLKDFFTPFVTEFRSYDYNVEGFTHHSGYFGTVQEFPSNMFTESVWEYTPSMTILLRRTHPDCTSGAAYRITVIYPSEINK